MGILADDVTKGGGKFDLPEKVREKVGSVHSRPMPASLPPPVVVPPREAVLPFSVSIPAATVPALLRAAERVRPEPARPRWVLPARLPFVASPAAFGQGDLTYQEPTEVEVFSGPGDFRENGVVIFTGGVRAVYGVTTLLADTLVVRVAPEGASLPNAPAVPPVTVDVEGRSYTLGTEEGYAEGNVRIIDPDGTVNADRFSFSWREGARRGEAEAFSAEVGGTRLAGSRIVYTPEKTTIYDAFGTACRRQTLPFLAARSRKVDIVPGQRATVERPQLQILGQRLPALPTNLGFSLDPRTEGLRLPSITYNRTRNEFGVAAGGNYLLDRQTQVDFDVSAFPSNRPRYGAQYFHSTLPPDAPQGRLAAISDLDERFFYSWFTSIFSGEPDSEVNYLRQLRSSYGASTQFNAGATGRPPGGGPYTKLLEGIVERGGPLGVGGYQTQLRASAFREGFGAFGPRISLNADYAQEIFRRGRFSTIGRFDTNLIAGKGLFGYAGGEVGGSYDVAPGIRFGASAFAYAQAGDSGYTLDAIRYPTGFSFRADLNSAPTKYSLLLRFDERGRQFDREYRFSQVIGCLEPVIAYREYPRSYQIGLRFRLDDLTNILQRRDPRRRGAKQNPFER